MRLLHELLGEAASVDPERAALSTPAECWSYGRLEATANAMAADLVELGVQRGDRVAILLPKRPEAVAAVYGILKAGAAYVPLNPFAPVPYGAAMCSDSGVSALVSTASRASAVIEALETRRPRGVLLVDEPGESGQDLPVPAVKHSEATTDHPPAIRGRGEDLACLLYTSGSTGAPKGVMHSHDTLLAGTQWFCRTMGIGPADRLYAHSPLHFMLSVYAVFPAARTTATAVLSMVEQPMRGDMARLVPEGKITVWVSTPFALRLLLDAARSDSLASLRTIMCGGGSLLGTDLSTIRQLAPRARVWQAYGSTEAQTVSCHLVEGDAEAGRPLAIGDPIEDVTVLLVGDDGAATAPAQEGELYVRGPRLMQGYWADPERTAQALVSHPFDGEDGGLFFRTGDVVKQREDGKLEFVKRTDLTVKSRGYRVNLNEVEGALNDHPAVRESVVVPVPHPEFGVSLVGCVELARGTAASESELKRHVAARLPSYMVPQRIRIVSELPRTSTGKADRSRVAAEFSEGE